MPPSGPLNNNWENIAKNKDDSITSINRNVAKDTGMGCFSMGNLSWDQNGSTVLNTSCRLSILHVILFNLKNKSISKIMIIISNYGY